MYYFIKFHLSSFLVVFFFKGQKIGGKTPKLWGTALDCKCRYLIIEKKLPHKSHIHPFFLSLANKREACRYILLLAGNADNNNPGCFSDSQQEHVIVPASKSKLPRLMETAIVSTQNWKLRAYHILSHPRKSTSVTFCRVILKENH